MYIIYNTTILFPSIITKIVLRLEKQGVTLNDDLIKKKKKKKAVGFLVPRSQASFPVPRPHPTFRFFVPPFFVPCSQIYHTNKSFFILLHFKLFFYVILFNAF